LSSRRSSSRPRLWERMIHCLQSSAQHSLLQLYGDIPQTARDRIESPGSIAEILSGLLQTETLDVTCCSCSWFPWHVRHFYGVEVEDMEILLGAVQWALIILLAPLVHGFMRWGRLRWSRLHAPSFWVQSYRDLWKLFHKVPKTSQQTIWWQKSHRWRAFGASLLLPRWSGFHETFRYFSWRDTCSFSPD